MKPTEIGRMGEDLAVAFLQTKGFIILARNYRFGKAEIDIIAQKQNRLSVVEVKWRSRADYGLPQSFVTPKKQRLLISVANHFVQTKNLDVEISLDIISILRAKNKHIIEFIENAYYFF